MPTLGQARQWLDRWDRQQEYYMADREERFAVIADVVAATVGRPDPLIVDIGAGPGSLSVRLLDRLPRALVIAVDADPLLLGLARAAYGEQPGLRIVERDLRAPDWPASLGLGRPADAVVSTTALHWLTHDELAAVYRGSAEILRNGGVFVDGDHLYEPSEQPRLHALTHAVRDARTTRVAAGRDEDWESWWAAADAAPELAALVGARGARPIDHTVPQVPTLTDHVRYLRDAGFVEVGTVWQHGDDRVLVALR